MPHRFWRRAMILMFVAAGGLIVLACSSPAPASTATNMPGTEVNAAQVEVTAALVIEANPTLIPQTAPLTATTAPAPTNTLSPPTLSATEQTQPPATTEPAVSLASTNTAPLPSSFPKATEVGASPAVATATSKPADASPAEGGDLTFKLIEGQNEARFIAEEQLVGVGINKPVGKTPDVTGRIVIRQNGTFVAEQSKIVIDLRTLTSDERRRDGYIQRSTLNTRQFPNAEFVPKDASGLPSPLPSSGTVDFQMAGDLTVHGVTVPTTWDVRIEISGQELTGSASTHVTMTGFGMTPPRVGPVLSIEDEIVLELDFRAALVTDEG